MGSQIFVALDTTNPQVQPMIERVPAWFNGWEQRLSRFLPESELNELNHSQGELVHVSHDLWDVLQYSRKAYSKSQGLVNVTMLKELEGIGYDKNFLDLREPTIELLLKPSLSSKPGFNEIEFDDHLNTIRMPVGVTIDLSGVAKGWAAHQTMLMLGQFGPTLVNAGGDIAINIAQTNKEPWLIGITDPFYPEKNIKLLKVASGGVATSGKDYHRWQVNGRWMHHLLDPPTGQPAITDILTATVIASTVMEAETAAKTVLIMGSCEGMKWLESQSHLAGLMILDDGKIVNNELMWNYL
jgi:thiamine biosynthesis lipoprotein